MGKFDIWLVVLMMDTLTVFGESGMFKGGGVCGRAMATEKRENLRREKGNGSKRLCGRN